MTEGVRPIIWHDYEGKCKPCGIVFTAKSDRLQHKTMACPECGRRQRVRIKLEGSA